MDINLKGKAPTPQTLPEANKLIKSLWEIACDLNEKKKTNSKDSSRNILLYSPALWRFLETEGIEPTNNLAEQMIRTLAIWRKNQFWNPITSGYAPHGKNHDDSGPL